MLKTIKATVYPMWDKRLILCILALVCYSFCMNTYFFQLFWGSWSKIHAKCLYYTCTSVIVLFFILDDLRGYSCTLHFKMNIITKLLVLTNFILFTIILNDLLPFALLSLLACNGSIVAITIMVLSSGIRHGAFKKSSILNNAS